MPAVSLSRKIFRTEVTMGKRRKRVHVGPIDMLFLLLSVGGFIFAIIGIFIPWMGGSVSSELVGESASIDGMGLFSDELGLFKGDGVFPVGVVQAFAIIAVVLSALCAVGVVLKVFEVVRIKGLLPFLFAAATIVIGALVAVFSYSLAGTMGGIDGGEILQAGYFPIVGMYFCAVGTIVSGAAMLLKRG